ncbi:ABC transporter permease [Pseudooceanicola sp. CBS1P-1]|uniref:ABC transporter permease subunit n=1 Tax=Pseudooceanicola albus TaxID=2692189 RepID=A0A6L7FYK8_9RHOB|nr:MULTISPECIES: ABC transporter permease [Pseudooceanicola]MBT9383165.1 ABC transporter permease [Pseudooceanicola endophyticus]MXN16512.1 ABC transporter permease subunit [Pseudooceanicola albus]
MSASFLLRRLAYLALTAFLVSLIVFGVTQLLPANAATMILGEYATPEALAALNAKLGLGDPAWLQYGHWLGRVLHGDFGTSLRTSQPVGPTILAAFGRSAILAILSLLLVCVIAIPLGVLAGTRRGGKTDLGLSVISYLGVSLPEFVLATLLLAWLAGPSVGLFPASGYTSFADDPLDALHHIALPVITLAIILIAHISRMVRSEMVDTMESDFVRAARLRGLSRRQVIYRHALRNSMLPAITVIALDVGYLIGGVIVVEEVFAFPGIGRQLILAIQNRDLPMLQAGALIMALTYALANLAADLAYAALDKRIQYQ